MDNMDVVTKAEILPAATTPEIAPSASISAREATTAPTDDGKNKPSTPPLSSSSKKGKVMDETSSSKKRTGWFSPSKSKDNNNSGGNDLNEKKKAATEDKKKAGTEVASAKGKKTVKAVTKEVKITPILMKEVKGRGEIEMMQVIASPDGRIMYCAGLRDSSKDAPTNGSEPSPWCVRFWTVLGNQAGKLVHTFPSERKCWEIALSNDGKRVLIAGSGRVDLWDSSSTGRDKILFSWPNPDDPKRIQKFKKQATLPVVFSHDGTEALIGNHMEAIVVKMDDFTQLQTLKGHTNTITDMKYSPIPGSNGTLFAFTASMDLTINLWNTTTGLQIQTFQGHTKTIQSIAVHCSGRLLLSGGDDKNARVWDVVKGGEPTLQLLHPGGITMVGFAPSGNYMVTTANDKLTRVYITGGSKVPVATMEGHKDAVRFAALYLEDGAKKAITCSYDKSINMWWLQGAMTEAREIESLKSNELLPFYTKASALAMEEEKKRLAMEKLAASKIKAKTVLAGMRMTPELEERAKKVTMEVLSKGYSHPWNRVKLIVCGAGNSGKSAICHSLLKMDYDDPRTLQTQGLRTFSAVAITKTGEDGEQFTKFELLKEYEGIDWKKHKEGKNSEKTSDKERVKREFTTHLARLVASTIVWEEKQKHAAAEAALAAAKANSTASHADGGSHAQNKKSSLAGSAVRRSSYIFQRPVAKAKMIAQQQLASGLVQKPPKIVARQKRPLTMDSEAMETFPIEKIGEFLELPSDVVEPIRAEIYDIGSQDPFDSMNHLCINEDAVFIVTFDMRAIVNSGTRKQAIKDLELWLRFVDMHDGDEGAPVFLIGTYKDKVSDPGMHRIINTYLDDAIDFRTIIPSLVRNTEIDMVFWPISNTKDPTESSRAELRNQLFEKMAGVKFLQNPVPLAWTRLYDKLQNLKQRSLSFQEVMEEARSVGIESKEEVRKTIELYHRLGLVIDLTGSDKLNQVIIMDVQWFIDNLAIVIRLDSIRFKKHFYEFFDSKDLNRDVNRMFAEGVISLDLLDFFWKNRLGFFLTVLQELNLLCPWPYDDYVVGSKEGHAGHAIEEDDYETFHFAGKIRLQESIVSHYFVPSLLSDPSDEAMYAKRNTINRECPEPDYNDVKGNRPATAIVDFSSKFLPTGFYDRLVCMLINHSFRSFPRSRKPIMIRRSCLLSFGEADFRLDEDIENKRIRITTAEGVNGRLIIKHMDSMLQRLQLETAVEYRFLVIVWRPDPLLSFVEVDLRAAKEELADCKLRKRQDGIVRGIYDTRVKLAELGDWLDVDVMTAEKDRPKPFVTEIIPPGFKNHCVLVNMNSFPVAGERVTVNLDEKAGATVSTCESSFNSKTFDESVSVVFMLSTDFFKQHFVVEALNYAMEKRKPAIFCYPSSPDTTLPEFMIDMMQHCPSELVDAFNDVDNIAIPVRLDPFVHEDFCVSYEIISRINEECRRLRKEKP